jgi:hypothetical protein
MRSCAPLSGYKNSKSLRTREPGKKFPGIGGIPHEFHIVLWDTINDELIKIYNTLLQTKYLTPSLTLGIIVFVHYV